MGHSGGHKCECGEEWSARRQAKDGELKWKSVWDFAKAAVKK